MNTKYGYFIDQKIQEIILIITNYLKENYFVSNIKSNKIFQAIKF